MTSIAAHLDGLEWRYLGSRSRAVHGFYRAPSDYTPARCGLSPLWFETQGWLGTGAQSEYERVAALPRCKRCIRLFLGDRGIEPTGVPHEWEQPLPGMPGGPDA